MHLDRNGQGLDQCADAVMAPQGGGYQQQQQTTDAGILDQIERHCCDRLAGSTERQDHRFVNLTTAEQWLLVARIGLASGNCKTRCAEVVDLR